MLYWEMFWYDVMNPTTSYPYQALPPVHVTVHPLYGTFYGKMGLVDIYI